MLDSLGPILETFQLMKKRIYRIIFSFINVVTIIYFLCYLLKLFINISSNPWGRGGNRGGPRGRPGVRGGGAQGGSARGGSTHPQPHGNNKKPKYKKKENYGYFTV